jgi:hypothetical protein
MLRVRYPCPSKYTSLSKVVVHNRVGNSGEGDRMASYSLDFVDAFGAMDRPSQQFVGTQQTYTFIPREWSKCGNWELL